MLTLIILCYIIMLFLHQTRASLQKQIYNLMSTPEQLLDNILRVQAQHVAGLYRWTVSEEVCLAESNFRLLSVDKLPALPLATAHDVPSST